jgi:hypothetical protein
VSQNERNIGDQRLLEYECVEFEPNIVIKRFTLADISKRATLNENKCLIM